MSALLELFKFVGSAVGLISGGFLVYDRVLRNWPIAFLAKDGHSAGVVVRNTSNETLIVDRISVSPNVLGLVKGHDVRAVVEAVVTKSDDVQEAERDCFYVVAPLGQLTFGIVEFGALAGLNDNDSVTIRLYWRNTRVPPPFHRSVKVRTTAEDIRRLKKMKE